MPAYYFSYFILIPVAFILGCLILVVIYMVTGMSFLDAIFVMSSKSAKLTCWHCNQETLANRKTCQHCGKELQ